MNIHPLDILPLKKNKKKIEFPQIPQPLQAPSFTTIICSPTKSGKSLLTVNLLRNHMFSYGDNVFEEIFYISPTISLDPTLEIIFKDEDIIKIHEEEELEHLDDILKDIIKNQKQKDIDDRKHVLIVLDDMVEYFKTSKTLSKLPCFNRHYKISLILITQSFVALDRTIRKNATSYILFQIYNKRDLDDIENEIGLNFPNFMDYYREATKEKYNFLYIDARDMALYHNFKKLLWRK
jgi:hypothetical protein